MSVRVVLALLCLLGLCACRTVPRFSAVDLQSPGWTLRQGQAIWQRPHGGPEIAGEILLATRADGQAFVQFSKGGFPLLIGQTLPGSWQVELPAQNKRYSGRGSPPGRLLVLHLPRALEAQPLPPGWSWRSHADGGWRLADERTGESLQGYFNP